MSGGSDERSFVIFGRDITKIPCFRNSNLYGIIGGVMCGLTRFMFTSRVKSATDFAVGSYILITLTYWTQCRYNYSKLKFEMKRTQHLLQNHMVYEGTVKEQEMDTTDNKPVDV